MLLTWARTAIDARVVEARSVGDRAVGQR
jgi:hypothetical protein